MQRIIIIVLVLAVVLAFMVTYVVRFNEAAVVTTFGRADASSVVDKPGLGFKLPYPFQKVTTYDKRVRLIQSDQETQKTADESQIILTTFMTWKVSNPLDFYKAFGGSGDALARDHYKAAEQILKTKLRSAGSAASAFRLDELVSATGKGSKLEELETRMLDVLKGAGDGGASLKAYGIEPVTVGIAGVALPANVTQTVMESMKAARVRIANQWIARGDSDANRIRSEADNNAKTIKDFADALAAGIRKQGDLEAKQYYEQMNQDPQLAVFLQNMDFMKQTWGRKVTLVLPTTLPGFDVFPPDAARKFGSGRPSDFDWKGMMPGGKPRAESPAGPDTAAGAGEKPDAQASKAGGTR